MTPVSLDQAIKALNLFQYRQCATWTNSSGVAQGPGTLTLTAYEAILVAIALFNPWLLDLRVPALG